MRQILSHFDGLSSSPVFKLLEKILIASIVLAIFLYPAHFGPTRLENFLLPLMVAVLLFKDRPVVDRYLIILLALNMLLGYTSVIFNLNMNYGLMESLRWLKYIIIVILFSSIGREQYAFILTSVKVAFIGMFVVNVLQLINPVDLGVQVASFYSHHPLFYGDQDSIDRTFRLIGTAINPNNNALLWLLMGIFFLVEYYNERKTYALIYVLLSFVFIIFTQSRTTLFTALVIGFLNVFLYRLTIRHYLFLGLTLATGVFIAIFFKFTYIWQLFLYNPLKLHSLKLRFAIWTDMWVYYLQRPLLGWGNPRNYEVLYSKSADNEFLQILLTNGAIGLFGILLIFIYTIFLFSQHRKSFKHSYLPIFTVICFLIISFTNTTITNIRMGLFFFMIWGLAYSFRNNRQTE